MLKFLKKLKLCTELVQETVHSMYLAKFFCDHHYQHQLMKCLLQLEHYIELTITSLPVKSVTLSQNTLHIFSFFPVIAIWW